MWGYSGQKRPDFADRPGPGQESVWDYPRPPALKPDGRRIEVFFGDELLAVSENTYRVLETASPPTFYIPPADLKWRFLTAAPGSSICEWKGVAKYWALSSAPRLGVVGWSYPDPSDAFRPIGGFVSFYPGKLACFVAGERVSPQPGRFYGGWVTSEIVGPMKGAPGTEHW
jgi:uncharacterized protein (DUF427 family)